MRQLLLFCLLSLAAAPYAVADFRVGAIELVHTVPVETALPTPDLREPGVVWSEMFDQAKDTIDIGQFYVASRPGSRFDDVIAHLAAAGARGVKIRFLMEERGKSASDMATIARLRTISNLEFRFFEFGKLSNNGIIHAKYMVVDGRVAYLGSQNFDWRSFAHIHETGVRIADAAIAGQIQQIFAYDWQAQDLIAHGLPVPPARRDAAVAARPPVYLVASPAIDTPGQVADSEAELVALVGQATSEVDIQLLDYAPLSYGPNHTRPYYAVIDTALRAAQARGVKIKLMVSSWNTEAPAIDYLKSLAVLPGIEVRIVTLP